MVRELTKLHEEVWRGALARRGEHIVSEVEPRGEYVLVVAGAPEPSPRRRTTSRPRLRAYLAAGAIRKTAVAEVARELGVAKRLVYDVVARPHPMTRSSSTRAHTSSLAFAAAPES